VPVKEWPPLREWCHTWGHVTIAQDPFEASKAGTTEVETPWMFLSTDSIETHWAVQRELMPGYSDVYLGEAISGVFSSMAPNVDLAYEIDNVIGPKTWYYPQFTNSTSLEAAPIINLGLSVGVINICYDALYYLSYRCSVAGIVALADRGTVDTVLEALLEQYLEPRGMDDRLDGCLFVAVPSAGASVGIL